MYKCILYKEITTIICVEYKSKALYPSETNKIFNHLNIEIHFI